MQDLNRSRRGMLAMVGSSLVTAVQAQSRQGAADGAGNDDPYRSHPWLEMRRTFLDSAPVGFDERVVVQGPAFAEDPMNVPLSVQVDAALGAVERLIVLVDRNPIKEVIEFQPTAALPRIALRFKLEQASPVRAAVKFKAGPYAGQWRVGGTWVDSTGGGCTVSGATRKDGTWSQTLGQVSGRLFTQRSESGSARLRLQVMHPMDTGLVAGVPAFFVSRLSVRDGSGRELALLKAFPPVSENPVFSFDFAEPPQGGVTVVGVDNNGNRISSRLP